MPYAQDHRKSILVADEELLTILNEVTTLPPNGIYTVEFYDRDDMACKKRQLRALLNKLVMGSSYVIRELTETSFTVQKKKEKTIKNTRIEIDPSIGE